MISTTNSEVGLVYDFLDDDCRYRSIGTQIHHQVGRKGILFTNSCQYWVGTDLIHSAKIYALSVIDQVPHSLAQVQSIMRECSINNRDKDNGNTENTLK